MIVDNYQLVLKYSLWNFQPGNSDCQCLKWQHRSRQNIYPQNDYLIVIRIRTDELKIVEGEGG